MKNEIINAIEELQKRVDGLTDPDEIAECFADYKAEVSGERKDLNKLEWDEIEELMKDPNKKKCLKSAVAKRKNSILAKK